MWYFGTPLCIQYCSFDKTQVFRKVWCQWGFSKMIAEWKVAWGRLSGHLHIWPTATKSSEIDDTRRTQEEEMQIQPLHRRDGRLGISFFARCFKTGRSQVALAAARAKSIKTLCAENLYSQKRCGGLEGRAGQATKSNTSQKEWKDLRNATRHLQRVLTSGAGRSCQQIQVIIRTRWNMKLIPNLKNEKRCLQYFIYHTHLYSCLVTKFERQ